MSRSQSADNEQSSESTKTAQLVKEANTRQVKLAMLLVSMGLATKEEVFPDGLKNPPPPLESAPSDPYEEIPAKLKDASILPPFLTSALRDCWRAAASFSARTLQTSRRMVHSQMSERSHAAPSRAQESGGGPRRTQQQHANPPPPASSTAYWRSAPQPRGAAPFTHAKRQALQGDGRGGAGEAREDPVFGISSSKSIERKDHHVEVEGHRLPPVKLRGLKSNEVQKIHPNVKESRSRLLDIEREIHRLLDNIESSKRNYLVASDEVFCEREIDRVTRCYEAVNRDERAVVARGAQDSMTDPETESALRCADLVAQLKKCARAALAPQGS